MNSEWWNSRAVRLSIALGATIYFAYYAETATAWHFIDNIDLIIHEAGHIVFMFFGEFMHILGGSLFQTIFPMIYIGYFYFKQQYFSASLLLFWVGVNLLNVSIYAGDAIVMQLPLLGGDTDGHDWHNLLTMTHTLQYTSQISGTIWVAGLLTIAAAAALSIYTALYARPEKIRVV